MRLDHFVVHVDADATKLKEVARDATEAGMPFNERLTTTLICDPQHTS